MWKRRWMADVEFLVWLGLLGVMLWGMIYVRITVARNLMELVLLYLIGWLSNQWWTRRHTASKPDRGDETADHVVDQINVIVQYSWQPSDHESHEGQ